MHYESCECCKSTIYKGSICGIFILICPSSVLILCNTLVIGLVRIIKMREFRLLRGERPLCKDMDYCYNHFGVYLVKVHFIQHLLLWNYQIYRNFPSNWKWKFSTLWSILKDALDSSKEVFTVVECIHAKHKENSREGAQLTKPIAINVEPVDWKNVLILLWTKMVSAKSISLLSQRLM